MQSDGGKLIAWLQLIRLPNLLTVPGDPLAGYFLALSSVQKTGSVLFPVTAGILLYMAGLILNDLADLKVDSLERPSRPLPSGSIKPVHAGMTMMILFIVALWLAAQNGLVSMVVAITLVVAIIIYNVIGKKIPVLGPLNMGVCRGLSLLLGASAAGLQGITRIPVLIAAGLLIIYIAEVTLIASKETVRLNVGYRRWLPVTSIIIFVGPLCWFSRCASNPLMAEVFSTVLAGALLFWCWRAGTLLAGSPVPAVVSSVIGRFIQGLIVLQALFLSLCNWPAQIAAGLLILIFPVFSILARRFYSS